MEGHRVDCERDDRVNVHACWSKEICMATPPTFVCAPGRMLSVAMFTVDTRGCPCERMPLATVVTFGEHTAMLSARANVQTSYGQRSAF